MKRSYIEYRLLCRQKCGRKSKVGFHGSDLRKQFFIFPHEIYFEDDGETKCLLCMALSLS